MGIGRDCIICGGFIAPPSPQLFCSICASTPFNAAVVASLIEQRNELKERLAEAKATIEMMRLPPRPSGDD